MTRSGSAQVGSADTDDVRTTPDASLSLAHAVEDYLVACRARGVKPSTIKNQYGYPLRAVFLPWCQETGIIETSQLTQRVIDHFAADVREKPGRGGRPLSSASIWTYLKSVRQFMAWLHEDGGADAVRIRLGKQPKRQVEVLERDQIRALERAAVPERDRVIVRLLGDSGVRPGELCSITKRSLHRDSRRYFVRVIAKGGSERDVPVRPELWKRIAALARGDEADPVFLSIRRDPRTGEYEPLTPHGVGEMVAKLAEEAGIRTKVTPYTFRHSACRWMLLSGMSTIEVEAVLGHGSDKMIREHYNNLGKSDAYDRLIGIIRAEG